MEKQARHTNVRTLTFVIFVATFMSAIEGTIVTTCMPTIIGHLKGVEMMNWVFAIYLLAMSMMTPIYGKLVDTIGRKPVFVLATLLFAFGSFLSGLSHSMMFLIVSRAIQGVGAGGILPVTYTLLADMYEPKKRAKILGYNSAIWGIAGIIGPVLGGMILQQLSWHWIFFINVPVAFVVIFLLMVSLKEEKQEKKRSELDILGSFLLMLAIFSLLLGVQFLSDGHVSVLIFVLFLASVVLGVLFYLTEKKAKDPVMPLHLFHNRHFNVINLSSFFISGFLILLDVYVPIWLQGLGHFSPTISGMVLTPMSISWMLGSFLASHWIEKYGDKWVLAIGGTITLFTAIGMYFFRADTSIFLFVLMAIVSGVGFGLQFTVYTVSVQVGVREEEIGVATSFSLLVRNLGQTILVAIFGVLLNFVLLQRLPKGLSPKILNALLAPSEQKNTLTRDLTSVLYEGLHSVVGMGVMLCIVATLLIFLLKKQERKSS